MHLCTDKDTIDTLYLKCTMQPLPYLHLFQQIYSSSFELVNNRGEVVTAVIHSVVQTF